MAISGLDIAKLIGKVFLQKSAVNLLGSVLGTPEFFWHAPDSFQVRVCVCTRCVQVCVCVLNTKQTEQSRQTRVRSYGPIPTPVTELCGGRCCPSVCVEGRGREGGVGEV